MFGAFFRIVNDMIRGRAVACTITLLHHCWELLRHCRLFGSRDRSLGRTEWMRDAVVLRGGGDTRCPNICGGSATPRKERVACSLRGSARRVAITEMVESVGGQVEACYFAFGEDDLFVIGDVPDEVVAAALAIRTAAYGAAVSHTVALLTPEQIDEAVARDVTYLPPQVGP